MALLTYEQEWGLNAIKTSSSAYVIGIDECGLGACAGPFVVCGAVFRRDWADPAVKDSKQYSGGGVKAHEKRVKVLKENITPAVLLQELEVVSHKDIDALGVKDALEDAMYRVALRCTFAFPGSVVAIDGVNKPLLRRASVVAAIPKGDALVPAVSAASVIAKTTRDAMMIMSADIYHGYGFEDHVGYWTEKHRDAVLEKGPCAIHRLSYKNIQTAIALRQSRGL